MCFKRCDTLTGLHCQYCHFAIDSVDRLAAEHCLCTSESLFGLLLSDDGYIQQVIDVNELR